MPSKIASTLRSTHGSYLALMHVYRAFRLAGSERHQSSSCMHTCLCHCVCVWFVGVRTLIDSGVLFFL